MAMDELIDLGTPVFTGYVVGSKFLADVEAEADRAAAKHPPFNSYHEGLAVIWEEFDEMKREVFKKSPDLSNLRLELVQIAAMCRRFEKDLL